jgi:hypothetical protein
MIGFSLDRVRQSHILRKSVFLGTFAGIERGLAAGERLCGTWQLKHFP